MRAGSLVIVGTGFGGSGQVTAETSQAVASADKVLFLVAHASTAEWIRAANPTAESLDHFYLGRSDRLQSYFDITEHILSFVRRALNVCTVFYGHPGVFVFPSHEAIIRARDEGFCARMLPAISAEDCLFSDLGVDPGRRGCQTFDATDFLVRRRQIDVKVPLILWQVGVVGCVTYPCPIERNRLNLSILADVLQLLYGPSHEVVLYEAAAPDGEPVIEFLPLERLAAAIITSISTLYVPPRDDASLDMDMARKLSLPERFLSSQNNVRSRYRACRPYATPKPRTHSAR